MFDLLAAYIVSLFVSSIFFGLSCATFLLCIRSLCDSPFRTFSRGKWALFFVCCAMFVVGCVAIGQQMRHNLNAFVYYKQGGHAEEELNTVNDPTNYIHIATYPVQTLLGDSMLIYRTYVIYNCNWRIIVVPILLMLGNSVGGWGMVYVISELKTGLYSDPRIQPWETTYITLTLCLNLLCTGMIVYHILQVSSASAPFQVKGSKTLTYIARIIIESGMIYTAHSLIILVVVLTRSLAFYPVADSFIHITSICFHLIIIRTGWHRQASQTRGHTSNETSVRFTTWLTRGGIRQHAMTTSDDGDVVQSEGINLKLGDIEENPLSLAKVDNPQRVFVTRETVTEVGTSGKY